MHRIVSFWGVSTARSIHRLFSKGAHGGLHRFFGLLACPVVKAGMMSAETEVLLVIWASQIAVIQPESLAAAYRCASTATQVAEVTCAIGELRLLTFSTDGMVS